MKPACKYILEIHQLIVDNLLIIDEVLPLFDGNYIGDYKYLTSISSIKYIILIIPSRKYIIYQTNEY
jgi:hypothetical protein